MMETTSLEVSRRLREAGIEIVTAKEHHVPGWMRNREKLEFFIVENDEPRVINDEPYGYNAATIAELRAHIEGQGEWEKFQDSLIDEEIQWAGGIDNNQIKDLMNKVTNPDSLAIAYINWPGRGKK